LLLVVKWSANILKPASFFFLPFFKTGTRTLLQNEGL
jgi:hypothetical protein